MKQELIYLWLDAEGNVRNKSRYVAKDTQPPAWSFDGSSTGQAVTKESDVKLVPASFRYGNVADPILVLCNMRNKHSAPIPSDYRTKAVSALKNSGFKDWIFGFEQEYVIWDNSTRRPLGWSDHGEPKPQGEYYCGKNYGRHIVEEHAKVCNRYDLQYFGNNAEVMPGQWEYQIGPAHDEDVQEGIVYCDDLIFSRFLLQLVAERFNCNIDYSPKPVPGDWNGSGLHTNFSTLEMRNKENEEKHSAIESATDYILRHLKRTHSYYINNICGKGWKHRLTGELETSDPTKFTVDNSNRACSIRIPPGATYLEDRRPCANANPYRVITGIVV